MLRKYRIYRPLKIHVKIYFIIITLSECSAKGQVFHANAGIKAALLPKDRSSAVNSGTKFAVLLGIYTCGSFLLLSAPHSLKYLQKMVDPALLLHVI